MTPPSTDAHVRLDAHPAHTSAVTAILTGTRQDLARPVLTAHGFETLDDHTLVLARIDREEPHWAETAARARAQGITTHRPAPRSHRRGMDLGQPPHALVHPPGNP